MLTKIDLNTFGDKIEWLWEKLKTQGYGFDDIVKDDSQAFLQALFHPASQHWYNEHGFVSVINIQPMINADIHFFCWDESYSRRALKEDAEQVFNEAFNTFALERITATIPRFNAMAMKLAASLGMRYEGAMRRCVLHKDKYHDLVIYGILRSEHEEASKGLQLTGAGVN